MRVALFLTAAVSATPVAAQDPCAEPEIGQALARVALGTLKPVPLFDPAIALKVTPTRRINVPATVVPQAACVALTAQFQETNGTIYLQQASLIAAYGTNTRLPGVMRSRAVNALHDVAQQVVRELAQQNLFPTRPRPGTNYLIVLPISQRHPLYQGGQAAAVAAAGGSTPLSLGDRGYRESAFLSRVGDVELYRIFERDNRIWLALVRSVNPTDRLLEFAGPPDPRLRMSALGDRDTKRFHDLIVPQLREIAARTRTVEIRHYGAGVHVAYRPDSRFPHNSDSFHPLTGDTVEVPIAVERWTGERAGATGPYTWKTTGAFGTRESEFNTLAAIQAHHDSIGSVLAKATAYRAARDVKERELVLAGRARVAARERSKPALYAAKRLTYREPEYWTKFQLGRQLRMIHDGFYPDALRDWRFGRIFFRAVTTYGDECRKFLPAGVALRIDSTFRSNWRDEMVFEKSDTIFIHPSYARVFKGWFERSLDVPASTPAEATPSAVLRNPAAGTRAAVDLGLVKEALRGDIKLLHGEGCQSGTLLQFMENLRRLADREPTLQAQLVPSTLPSPDDPPSTIGEACTKYDLDNGDRTNPTWCACLDRILTPRYRPTDLPKLLENYSAFIERVSYPPNGDERNNIVLEYRAADACRQ